MEDCLDVVSQDVVKIDSEREDKGISSGLSTHNYKNSGYSYVEYAEINGFPIGTLYMAKVSQEECALRYSRERGNNLHVHNNGEKNLFLALLIYNNQPYIICLWSGSPSNGAEETIENMITMHNSSTDDRATYGAGTKLTTRLWMHSNGGVISEESFIAEFEEGEFINLEFKNYFKSFVESTQVTQVKVNTNKKSEVYLQILNKFVSSLKKKDSKFGSALDKSGFDFSTISWAHIFPVITHGKNIFNKSFKASLMSMFGANQDNDLRICYIDIALNLNTVKAIHPLKFINKSISEIKKESLLSDSLSSLNCDIRLEKDFELIEANVTIDLNYFVGNTKDNNSLVKKNDKEFGTDKEFGSGYTSLTRVIGQNGFVLMPCLSNYRQSKGNSRIQKEPVALLDNVTYTVRDMLTILCEVPDNKKISFEQKGAGNPYCIMKINSLTRKVRSDKNDKFITQSGEPVVVNPDFTLNKGDKSLIYNIFDSFWSELIEKFYNNQLKNSEIKKIKKFIFKYFLVEKQNDLVDWSKSEKVNGKIDVDCYVLDENDDGEFFRKLENEDRLLTHEGNSGNVLGKDEKSSVAIKRTIAFYDKKNEKFIRDLDHCTGQYQEKITVKRKEIKEANRILKSANINELPNVKNVSIFEITIPKLQRVVYETGVKAEVSPNGYEVASGTGTYRLTVKKKNKFIDEDRNCFYIPDLGNLIVRSGGGGKGGSKKTNNIILDGFDDIPSCDLPIVREVNGLSYNSSKKYITILMSKNACKKNQHFKKKLRDFQTIIRTSSETLLKTYNLQTSLEIETKYENRSGVIPTDDRHKGKLIYLNILFLTILLEELNQTVGLENLFIKELREKLGPDYDKEVNLLKKLREELSTKA
jgi:hypothetical protein